MQKNKASNLSQNFIGTGGMVDEQELSRKERKVRKAVMLYYGKDMTQEEVSEELGVTRRTVANYLDSDTAKGFEKIFSHKDKEELDRWLQEQLASSYNKSMEGLQEARERAKSPEVSPQVLTNASLAMLKSQEKLISLLQEIGVKQKPKERKEVTERSKEADDVLERLQDAYQEKQEKESLEASK